MFVLYLTYADEACTGTKAERAGFQELLSKCRSGEIEMVITKSISRLARNTVTTLESVRELKSLGVDVYFEEEQIHSLSADGELMLTLLASFAQEESRAVSENVKWRIRKDFRDGKISGCKMLGYHVINGKLVLIPEDAELVTAIFADYLSGMGIIAITKKYRAQGIKISTNGIAGILRNEKYNGNMLLQKSFVDNHIDKKKVRNTGQLPQYFVENSHEPIIDKETFSAVQVEIKRRAAIHTPKQAAEKYPLTGIIKCGKCGAAYKRKIVYQGKKPQCGKIVWICNKFNDLGKNECGSQQIPENILMGIISEVGGLENISQITVPAHFMLHFRFKNGNATVVQWQYPSRRESWTDEMKEAARKKRLEVLENGK